MKELNNLLFRPFPGDHFRQVRIFTSKKNPLQLLTLPIKFEKEYVMIATVEPYSALQIRKTFPECRSKVLPFHVVKNLSKAIRMPVVTIINSFCSAYTYEEIFEVYYYSPPKLEIDTFRGYLS